MKSTLFVLAILLSAGLASALEPATPDRVTATFSDASRPGLLKVNMVSGSITVKGYNGKEVVIEAAARDRGGREEAARGGLRRIPITATGLNVEEENNVMRVSTGSVTRAVDLTIQVPHKTSLNLRTVNDGDIEVSDVDGELDVNDVNGAVRLNRVAGVVVAHALNGELKATITRADAKPMAFSSLNGTIDVTFPADLKANVSLSNEMGEVYSDFDIKLQAGAPQQTVEDGRGKGGKYRVRIDKVIRGAINGGGPEIQFKNFNGEIYIRKAGA